MSSVSYTFTADPQSWAEDGDGWSPSEASVGRQRRLTISKDGQRSEINASIVVNRNISTEILGVDVLYTSSNNSVTIYDRSIAIIILHW